MSDQLTGWLQVIIGFVSLVLMIFQCRIRRSRRKNPGLHWRHWEGLGIRYTRLDDDHQP